MLTLCVAIVTAEEACDDPNRGLKKIKEVGCYDNNYTCIHIMIFVYYTYIVLMHLSQRELTLPPYQYIYNISHCTYNHTVCSLVEQLPCVVLLIPRQYGREKIDVELHEFSDASISRYSDY